MSATQSRGQTPILAGIKILSGQTVSNAIDLHNVLYAAIALPTMTSTTMTFQGSVDGVTYQAINAAGGTAVSLTIASNKNYALPADVLAFPFVKLVAGSAEGADRVIPVARKG